MPNNVEYVEYSLICSDSVFIIFLKNSACFERFLQMPQLRASASCEEVSLGLT